MEDLVRLVKKLNPLETLSVLAFYCCVGKTVSPSNTRAFLEVDLELVQYAFVIAGLNSNQLKKKASLEDIIALMDCSQAVREKFMNSRLNYDLNSERLSKYHCAESARIGAGMYRNWAYPEESIEIMKEIILPLKIEVKKKSGIDLEVVLKIFCNLLSKLCGGRTTVFYNEGKSIKNLSDKATIDLLLNNQNINNCINNFSFNTSELAIELNEDEASIISVLDVLSYSCNCIEEPLMEQVLQYNPVTTKPFVKISNKRYLIPSPSIINTYYTDIFLNLLHEHGNNKVYDMYRSRIGKYIESKTFEIFRTAFPFNEIYKNVYLDNYQSNENDIIFKYGDIIFIIEVKSNGINKGVKSGGVNSLHTMLEQTIVKGSKQSLKLKNKLINGGVARIGKTKNIDFIIDPTKNTKFVRLVVLFRELGGLHTNYRNYEEITGFLGDDLLVMTLTDLMVVFDILSSPSERVDYLLQRMRIEKNLRYKGDEMDILGWYLNSRLDINHKKYAKTVCLFDNHSKSIDEYKNSKMLNGSAIKPIMPITPLWLYLIERLEENIGVNSRAMTSDLFRVNESSQKEISEVVNKFCYEVKLSIRRDEYRTLEILIHPTNNIIQLVITKHGNLYDFNFTGKEKLNNYQDKPNLVHKIYLNASKNGEYAGCMSLKPKTKKIQVL